ncbi:hypothetical protein Cni_G05147 [Canna indica]|uniref:Uncharacterized protein n=1 Tax=Canna indica TaxID=4628 RepID=A0AAQ3JYJ0_9LILI|nr:hypothetical protein Cni_G05147 [Canna indica]
MARLLLHSMLFLALTLALAAARSTPPEIAVAATGSAIGSTTATSPSWSSASADRREVELAARPPTDQAFGRSTKHHRRPDKSIAGAEVILGGLATAVLGAIFAYIRVTRKKEGSENYKA